jgi:sugar O-acyltransferase (sialic acid O-acetyltransferase NeuD family)
VSNRLIIHGSGGHGKVCAEAAELMSYWDDIVFVDKRYPSLKSCGKWSVIGLDINEVAKKGDAFFVAVGDNATRRGLLEKNISLGYQPATIVHPSAVVSLESKIGVGVLVCAAAVVNVGAEIGDGCIVNTAASIDHDCKLGLAVHLSPGVHLAGEVTIGDESWLGTGVSTKQLVAITNKVVVGVGAAVVNNLSIPGTYVGAPATRIA